MHHADGDTTRQYVADINVVNTDVVNTDVVNTDVVNTDVVNTRSVVANTSITKATIDRTLTPNAPIGLFDSGVGGLSIYQHLKQALPSERYIYYADTMHVPYGDRHFTEIETLTINAVDWLIDAGCKLVIVACNSASTHALESLRARHRHIPIVGLVPALKPAVLLSKTGRVAVLATKATLEGKLLNQVITDYAVPHHITVTKWCDASLVPWVEAGMPTDAPAAIGLVAKLEDIAASGVDYVVLGCTHYPFFRPFLQKYIDDNDLSVTLIDSGQAIAARVRSLLTNVNTVTPSSDDGAQLPKLEFFSSKSEPHLQALVMRLVEDIEVNFI